MPDMICSSLSNIRHARFFFATFLFVSLLVSHSDAQNSRDFVGNWVLRLGNRPLLVVTLASSNRQDGSLSGALVRPKFSYQSGTESAFFAIGGTVLHYPLTQSQIKENCLLFTTQNPADEKDEDNYRLCSSGHGSGTLGYDFPGVDSWPVTMEKDPPVVATDWESRSYFLDDTDVSNPEMQQISEQDQKDRQLPFEKIDWAVVSKADAARLAATRQLLAAGKLHTGIDFERASLIFQHSDAPDDYLLAHTLAIVALARGRVGGAWMAAATLDRYLQTMHQPQIYGTQTNVQQKPATQEPYNRFLISDSLRRMLNVPSLAAQEELRKQYESQQSAR